jgi:hypothetical protein
MWAILIFGVVVLAVSLALYGLLLYAGVFWRRTIGRVVRVEPSRIPLDHSVVLVVSYEVAEETFEIRARGFNAGMYSVGAAVRVCHPPGRPAWGLVVTGREWLTVVLCLGVALACFLAAWTLS